MILETQCGKSSFRKRWFLVFRLYFEAYFMCSLQIKELKRRIHHLLGATVTTSAEIFWRFTIDCQCGPIFPPQKMPVCFLVPPKVAIFPKMTFFCSPFFSVITPSPSIELVNICRSVILLSKINKIRDPEIKFGFSRCALNGSDLNRACGEEKLPQNRMLSSMESRHWRWMDQRFLIPSWLSIPSSLLFMWKDLSF